jgi:DNA-binding response OmpR family regulator
LLLFFKKEALSSIQLNRFEGSGRKMRILVVEDNASLRGLIVSHLENRGFAVQAEGTGGGALAAISCAAFDALILDLGLPDMDGLAVLRGLREAARNEVPVVILTARDSLEERVAGLDSGADDYVVKPFEVAELEARLRAVLRRPGKRVSPVHVFDDLSFDTASREARCNGDIIELTPRESGLFEELVRGGAGIVVRDALLDRLFRLDESVSANALEAIVSRLRRKLLGAGSCVRIETMRGIGYRLKTQ